MKIHTSATEEQVIQIIRSLPNVSLHDGFGLSRSRTHERAFNLRLEGSGGRNNTGLYGAGNYHGATWDEWGAVLASIFRADPKARMGGSEKRPVYRDAEHFHIVTGERFLEPGIPADTHSRHRWQGARDERTCARESGCSAIWRPGRSYSPDSVYFRPRNNPYRLTEKGV